MQQKSPRAESDSRTDFSGVAAVPSGAESALCQRGRRETLTRCGVGSSAAATDTQRGWMLVLSWDHWSCRGPSGPVLAGSCSIPHIVSVALDKPFLFATSKFL